MWSRVRHRRLQAVALVALAALLTTSLCLGPLYQRAMEQGLAGSTVKDASTDQKSLRLTSNTLAVQQLEQELPAEIAPSFTEPEVSRVVEASVDPPGTPRALAMRLYAVDGACQHLTVVTGSCPSAAGQVMVSTVDVKLNGWEVGSTAEVKERLPQGATSKPGAATVQIVGVYRPPPLDDQWLGKPITGRAGFDLQDVGPATDDWVTDSATLTGTFSGSEHVWYQVTNSVVWPIDPAVVGHDELLRIGPVVAGLDQQLIGGTQGILVSTDIPTLSDEVASGSDQGWTTVVVLVGQLLVLVAVVLWLVLVAATDDRRPELALARLRGRGRRGAAAYLLAELLPLTLGGVALGILAAPLVMALVADVVFPVPVPQELPSGFLLAALGSVAAVLAVVLAAARRAVREPVDSLLRAVPARHLGSRPGIAEIVVIAVSLTAVVALVTGHLKGPLATLAPTLLAVAVGLLLGRGLGPAVRVMSKWLLRRGRAVTAAGVVNAVRRPAARRILVMVVVASALFVFCVDALVTGQHNRENAAEQQNGAAYSLSLQATSLVDVVAAVAAADPHHEHLTPVISTPHSGSAAGPTVSVDPTAFPRVAYFPLSSPSAGNWPAIAAPRVDPVTVTGTTLSGQLASADVQLSGPSKNRTDLLRIGLQLLRADGTSTQVSLGQFATKDGSVPFQVTLPCEKACTVTGVTIVVPPGGRVTGTVVLGGVTADGAPLSLGQSSSWRRVSNGGGSLAPSVDADGNLAVTLNTSGSEPPVMVSSWVPEPVPALVTTKEEHFFTDAALEQAVDMSVAGTLPRVPGSPPGSRVIDAEGLLRRGDIDTSSDIVSVWSDDSSSLDLVRHELESRGVKIAGETTLQQARAQLDASPAAWSLALSVLVGGAAVLVAMLVMVVATATTWRSRATDLAALRMAGLPDRSLRRMELLGELPVVLVGTIAGAGCGLVAAVLAVPGIRQFTDPPAVDTTDFATPWAAVLLASAGALVLLTLLAVASSRWTARRAPLSRIREVV